MTSAVVVGAGPAGLMAADILSEAGVSVVVADRMPSAGRKFLMAGKSGLNITRERAIWTFIEDFGPDLPEPVAAAVEDFGPACVIDWAEGLGQDVFVGSSGRVFPTVLKASPLLRAWLGRLGARNVELRTRWTWTGWQGDALTFQTPDGERAIEADIVVLALGGASWRRLGSNGAWADWLGPTNPFQPANVGLKVDWSPEMAPQMGAPVKGTQLNAGDIFSQGEFVVGQNGLEGGGIYAVSRAVREGHALTLDLFPFRSEGALANRLAKSRTKQSLSETLRKGLNLSGVRLALLHEWGRPFPDDLAPLLKALPVRHAGLRDMDEAISTAGGLSFEGLDAGLQLTVRPGTFAAGEMLDWEAPTGGYLITACLATGRRAALAALGRL